jgi:hypothetical protein
MISSWARCLFKRQAVQASASQEPLRAAAPAQKEFRYPPTDAGLPVLEEAALLSANQDLIERLRTHSAARPDIFQQQFLSPIARLAREINTLPATSTNLFSGEMGLFRAALECAFFSYQASDGRIFTGSAGVEKRHALEGRWRYLCFAAGLIYPVGKTLERAVVTDEQGMAWSRHYAGITEWAQTNAVQRLFVSWATADDAEELGPSNAGLLLLPRTLGAENMQHLQDGSGDLVTCLYSLVSGGPAAAPIAHQVVTGAWERIVRREAARRPHAFGKVVAGSHLGPYLIGTIRALVDSGHWRINKGPLRADRKGVYLLWPDAAPFIIEHGKNAGYAGWPAAAATLAELLVASQIAERLANDLGFVELVDSAGEVQRALKIANPLSVLEDYDADGYPAPQTLKAVLASDPLAGVEEAQATRAAPVTPPAAAPAAPAAQPAAAAPAPASTAATPPAAETTAPPSEPGAGAPTPAATARAPRAANENKAPGKLVEGPEVRFSDLVPVEFRRHIGDPLHVEWLGKLVKLWRERAPDCKTMRRTEHGVAIAFVTLTEHLRDPGKWAESMSKAGLLYTPPQTPGAKVHDVAIPEGGKKQPAMTLSELACKKLGL